MPHFMADLVVYKTRAYAVATRSETFLDGNVRGVGHTNII